LQFLLLFLLVFASFHFRFASDAKTSKQALFSHIEAKKNFSSVSLHFASKRKRWQFLLLFVLFLLRFIFVLRQISTFCIKAKQVKKAKTFSLPFRCISLRSENEGAP
jgi:hypothetical protein